MITENRIPESWPYGKHFKTIEFIAKTLSRSNAIWVITGSTNHALQGVATKPKDIDILSDSSGIHTIEQHFKKFIVRPIEYSTLENVRSYYGKLNISGIDIDLIGDIENKLPSNIWEPHIDWQKNIRSLQIFGISIPILSLEYEYSVYKKLGKIKQAQKIITRIQS